MKIAFLGTGHGIGSPERHCSAALIESGDAIYYIDAGAPLFERTEALGFDAAKARVVFTTHAHGDHICGLYQFADLLNWAKRFAETRCRFFMTEKAVAEAMENLISLTAKPLDKSRLSFEIATEGLVYSDENIRVSYTPTRHIAVLNRPSYSIIIECEGKRVIFSGDMSQHLAEGDFPEAAYEECDLLVCELAHFSVEELTPYLKKAKAKRVAFSHVIPSQNTRKSRDFKGNIPLRFCHHPIWTF
jgi:ribonuclease BN (tRNA processing enzyme)